MQEGIVSVRPEEEQAVEEHVPLNMSDLNVINEVLSDLKVNRLRQGSRFIVTARNNGLQAGFDDDPRDDSILVFGPARQIRESFSEALDRGWSPTWDTQEPNPSSDDHLTYEFHVYPVR